VLEAWFRDRGSSEALIALEAGALVKAEIAPETQGSGETEPVPKIQGVERGRVYVRGQRG